MIESHCVGSFSVCTYSDICFFACHRAEGCTKHCRVKQEDQFFTIGTANFDSLVDLVKYYEHNCLFRRVKLRYAVTERVMQNLLEQVILQNKSYYVEKHLNICSLM